MTDADLRKQAWDFFQLQAGHRLTTFNFYIALCSVLSAGLGASLKVGGEIQYTGAILGFLLVLFSFTFWKLDSRNRYLIRGAEETLMYFEKQAGLTDEGDRPHVAKRFLREEFDTKVLTAANSRKFWANHYSYSYCLRVVFVAFAAVGALGVFYSVFRIVQGMLPASRP